MSAAPLTPPSRWLYGPLPDLLIGCGLWYALAFVALAFAGAEIRAGGAAVLMPFLVLAFGTPHYGATLLRVYQRREDRRAYAIFAIYASALIAAGFVAGVYDVAIGSFILTIYLTWSPWHYTGQNYGLAVMFLRRRGVAVTPGVKRLVYAAFGLSYALVFLALHSGTEASDYSPVVAYDPATYRFVSLGLPAGLAGPLFAAVGLAYLGSVAGALALLVRRAPLRDLAPSLCLLAVQALWFSIPLALRRWDLTPGIEPWNDAFGSYYFTWIAVGHSVQYLWVTSYYAKAGPAWRGQVSYFAKVMLAGAVIWTVPALVFAPGTLGRLPFDSGLALLVAAAVNIHHFVLDGAIWKLRDGRIARILVRSRAAESAPAGRPARGERWAGHLVYAAGIGCFLVMFAAKWERESLLQGLRARDVERVERALERMAWIGRESPRARLLQADLLRDRGRLAAAANAYRRSIELHPSKRAWVALGGVLAKQSRWEQAARAFEAALDLDPEQDMVLHELGLARLQLDQPDRARAAFARAAEIAPDRSIHTVLLERAEAAIRAREAAVAGAAPAT
jgi:tetratricopeptide (TPR) repeat protein